MFIILDRAYALEVKLVGYTTWQQGAEPQEQRALSKFAHGTSQGKHIRVGAFQCGLDIAPTTAHLCDLENTYDAHEDHKAGKDEVCPSYCFQTRRHNEQQADRRENDAQQSIIKSCDRCINAAESRNLRGDPAKRHGNRHQGRHDRNKFFVVREAPQYLWDS